jgi:hypothetical protein
MRTEIHDIAPGLWVWRTPHPSWTGDEEWGPLVASTCVESGGQVAVLDPLIPYTDPQEVEDRLDARPPTMVVILKPDHVRDVDAFAMRYHAQAYGPDVFHRDDVPKTDIEPIEPGTVLPGNMVALYDGRGRNETPIWVPEHRTLVFADALTAPNRELRVWATPWHEQRTLPALRDLLELPFDTVIVSHGDPVHDRGAYERALGLPVWSG